MHPLPFLSDSLFVLNQALAILGDLGATIGYVRNTPELEATQLESKQQLVDSYLASLKTLVDCSRIETSGQSRKMFDGTLQISHTAPAIAAIRDCFIYAVDLGTTGDKLIAVDVESSAQPAELAIPQACMPEGTVGDIVFELRGKSGNETFAFSSGTSAQEILAMINLFSEDTGITARIWEGGLMLESIEFGQDAIIEVAVISEPEYGQFAANLPKTFAQGINTSATINQIPAMAHANTISLKTVKLDMELALQAAFTGTLQFTITGGGIPLNLADPIQSELGRERIDFRVSLPNLLPSLLSSSKGRLFEIGQGHPCSLAQNPDSAYEIVAEIKLRLLSVRERFRAWKDELLHEPEPLQTVPSPKIATPLVNKSFPDYSLLDSENQSLRPKFPAQILVQSGPSVLDLPGEHADVFTRR